MACSGRGLLGMAMVLLYVANLAGSSSGVGGAGSRKLASLYVPPPLVLQYHHGPLLTGRLPLSIVWYGTFSPSQRAIVVDFLNSLHPPTPQSHQPSVSTWWSTVEKYTKKTVPPTAFGGLVVPVVVGQTLDTGCSLGKTLTRANLAKLASAHAPANGGGGAGSLTLVLTSSDVAVEGFCMGGCAAHGASSSGRNPAAYAWVGNSATQCPGTCAWPFHQPIYGPQSPPLVAPNGDVGIDGMVINIAAMLAAAVTNPLGTGYYQGAAGAPLEAASACPGIYGKGAYPGYAGNLLVEPTTGASYNAVGLNGRKYLLPALWDPETSSCTTLV